MRYVLHLISEARVKLRLVGVELPTEFQPSRINFLNMLFLYVGNGVWLLKCNSDILDEFFRVLLSFGFGLFFHLLKPSRYHFVREAFQMHWFRNDRVAVEVGSYSIKLAPHLIFSVLALLLMNLNLR